MKYFRKHHALFLLLAAILLISGANTASALAKPSNVTAAYDAANDKLVVEWDEADGAEKYKVIVATTDGEMIVKGSASGLIKKFPGSNFQTGVEYKVKVQSLDGGSKSKFVVKSYFHTLSRASGKGVLLAANSFGRTGQYYLPPKFGKKPRPLLVGFHGQGGDGSSMIAAFQNFAKEFGFIIVAPDSGLMDDNTSAWLIGVGGSVTTDYTHIRDCIDEVLAFKDVQIDPTRVLAVGYSAGGAVAPYFATSDVNAEFTHFAVLHGGVVFNTLGNRIIPAWLSTGTNDTLRTPTELQAYESILQGLGFEVIYTEYAIEHALGKQELRDVTEWWLDK